MSTEKPTFNAIVLPQWIGIIILGAVVTYLFVSIPSRVKGLEVLGAENRKMIEAQNESSKRIEAKLDQLIVLHLEGKVK